MPFNLLNPSFLQLWETIHQTEPWGGLNRQGRQDTTVRYALSPLSFYHYQHCLQAAEERCLWAYICDIKVFLFLSEPVPGNQFFLGVTSKCK